MYRYIDTEIWDDPWYSNLSPRDKLMFLYLLTNRRTTSIGVFEITVKAMAFETGIEDKLVPGCIERLAEKVVWYADEQTIWIRNFFRRQNKNANDKLMINARKTLATVPATIRADVIAEYPEFDQRSATPAIPHPPITPASEPPPIPLPVSRATAEPPSILHPYPIDGDSTVLGTSMSMSMRDEDEKTLAPKTARVRPVNATWDAVAALCGAPETETEKSDFGKTIKELDAAHASPDQIAGFGSWWDENHAEAKLTHRCLRGHWGRYLNAPPPRAPTITSIKSNMMRSALTVDLSGVREELENQHAARRRVSPQTGRLGDVPAAPRRLEAGDRSLDDDVLPDAIRS